MQIDKDLVQIPLYGAMAWEVHKALGSAWGTVKGPCSSILPNAVHIANKEGKFFSLLVGNKGKEDIFKAKTGNFPYADNS